MFDLEDPTDVQLTGTAPSVPVRARHHAVDSHGQNGNRWRHPVSQTGVFTAPRRRVQHGLISRYSTRFDPSTISAKRYRFKGVVIVSTSIDAISDPHSSVLLFHF